MSSTLLQIQKVSKAYGSRTIFARTSFAINSGEHVGVIGPNGAGKTTLFRILTGQEEIDEGEVIRSAGVRVGYLAQHDHFGAEQTGEQYLDGLSLPLWELRSLGRQLGLSDQHFSVPLLSLSGGYRMRFKLLYLLGEQPDLMLLDEPTNYLDLETLLVLENFLQGYTGAFLLISHDREFLRRTTNHILEVEAGEITKYPGSIDDYFEQKAMLRAQLEARALSLEARRKEVLDFVARFGAKASKASQAQSRLKSLDRMETIELKALPVQAKVRIPAPTRIGKLIVEVNEGEAGYPTKTILRGLEFQLSGGDKVGVVGLNGAGKTTFLRTLAGELPLKSGQIKTGFGIDFAYYGQHVAERLNPNRTVLESLVESAPLDTARQDVLDLAGSLLFSGDDAHKKISVLSGGEKSRVALGQVLLRRASCLLFDEPTNHLDFYTVEALTQALSAYPGTVVVVSHDRGFISRVATKILEVSAGHVRLYSGTYDDYVWSLSRGVLASSAKTSAAPAPPGGEERLARPSQTPLGKEARVELRERRNEIEKRLRQIRKRVPDLGPLIDAAHHRVVALSEELTRVASSGAAQLAADLATAQSQLEGLENEWLGLTDEEAALKDEFEALGKQLSAG
ncbi:MAG: ATP-binding cassette domain-containing protein [Bdellovibrionales bacterium]|nr:ATP-binding cassette domain-containing protein [Bdellovibrionales bacterium]